MNPSLTAETIIYTERTDDGSPLKQEDIEEYAKRIGINISSEPELLYLAREGLRASLPDGWKPCRQETQDRDVWFYFNSKTLKSQWEHPMDFVYREKVIQARSELALNKIQNFDTLTMRPPKSLPPLKRSGASLAPLSSAASSLGKLGGFRPAAGDLRQAVTNLANSSHNSHNPASNNNNSMGGFQNNSNANIISSSSLNTFKDMDDDDDDSLRVVRPQVSRKLGLTLTGGGANFMKGSEGFSKTRDESKDHFISSKNMESADEFHEMDAGGSGDSDKRQIKSILVNSISRSRPINPSDNIYELDGFSMNLDEMTDEEKKVASELESTTASKSKGNVKFNLDENTELKFELPDENDDSDSNENQPQNDTEEETEPEENYRGSPAESRSPRINPFTSPMTNRESTVQPLKNVALTRPPIKLINKNELPFTPEFTEEDIAAMKKKMRDEMETELNKFKERLEEERKRRQEQIQKHLEETVTQFKIEKEDTIKKMRKDFDNEKSLEVDKAKREIDSLLQKELDEMKVKFSQSMQERQRELEDEHKKKIEALTAEFRKSEEDTHQRMVEDVKAFMGMQKKALSQAKIEGYNTNESQSRNDTEEESEENYKGSPRRSSINSSISQTPNRDSSVQPVKNNAKTRLNKLINKHELPFTSEYSEEDIAAIKKSMRNEMEEELDKFKVQLDEERRRRQEQIQKHLEETVGQFKVEKEDSFKKAMKKAMRDEMEAELSKFKEQLEEERKRRQEQIQKHLEKTVAQFKIEKEDTLKKMRKEFDSEKILEVDKAKRELDSLLQKELEEMKVKFGHDLQEKQRELEKEHKKKIDILKAEFRKNEEDTHQRIVEDAKAFIRMQKNRLKDPSPIPNSSHLILPTTKNNLLLFDEKLLKSVSPRRPASIHLDLVSDTESSGVSSLKDHRSSESKKLSKDIDEICNSLISLDQQMKLIWSVVKDKQQNSYYHDQDESAFLNTSSDFTSILPNTVPIILGKSTRVCASLPTSARKPLVPPTMVNATAGGGAPSRNFSSLLSSNQNSSSQTVLDALRMSGLSTTRLDCTDLLKSLEEELKEFKTTKQKLLDIQETLTNDNKKIASPRHTNYSNSNILAKTKDLQEWIKKY